MRRTTIKLLEILQSGDPLEDQLCQARRDVAQAIAQQRNQPPRTMSDVLTNEASRRDALEKELLSDPKLVAALREVQTLATQRVQRDFIDVSGMFCIPPNPILNALRLRAELNLYKIRTCRNIAGMERELEPYAAPTDTSTGFPGIGAGDQLTLPGAVTIRPTQYRYKTLIERAKQLVGLAQQMEATFLSMLEKWDAERYNLLKARQDVRAAQAGVRLQELRVTEATHNVGLFELQKERAELQQQHYTALIETGLLESESQAVEALRVSAILGGIASGIHFAPTVGALLAGAAAGGTAGASMDVLTLGTSLGLFTASGAIGGATAVALATGSASSLAAGFSSAAQVASTYASLLQVQASFERRQQEWGFQRQLAAKDVAIGTQQVTLAQDRERIVGQEHRIAETQADHADEVVEFLNNKFTSAELYDWMSRVLEGVYRYFLQQATSMAKLAENQLAFERQDVPPAFVHADYWEAPVEGASLGTTDGSGPDRRGLTGSARLLQDIYQLDQYAFETDRRKLQLTRTLSLARLDPFAFQRFCEMGVMVFETPMALFDRDFPGHYLRLVKRVRTSVIALIPPTEGIRATLSSSGVSRVVIGGGPFQEVVVRRDPESVALTSPMNASGLFELQQEPEKMLPFEATGVDATWELRLPKAANPFDYRSIADVLVTIEYTALDSYDYRQEVIRRLDRSLSADRPFSFRHQFADAWYDLHNPDQTDTPLVVRFRTRREDFPPNVEELRIQQVLLYFARAEGASFEVPVAHLHFTEEGISGFVGGGAASVDGIISTRRGNGSSWLPMLGKAPVGEWELALEDTEEVRSRFRNEQIEELLFVVTFSGRTPEWPA